MYSHRKKSNGVKSGEREDQVIGPPGVLRVACLQAFSFTFQRPWRVNKAFEDMGVLTKYDQIEPIYLPHSVVTYIYLHPAYRNPCNVE
jgi:hypothetical protein